MSYPEVLLMNDIHCSHDNLSEFTKNVEEAIELCEKNGIKTIVVGGDLFQSRSAQSLSVLVATQKFVRKCKKKGIGLILANGNHDKVNPSDVVGYCHIVGDIVAGTSETLGFDFGYLCIVPYFPEDGLFTKVYEETVDFLKENGILGGKQPVYLYLHQEIQGGLAMPTPKALPADMFKDFDYVFVGHFHNRKAIEGTNVEYIGASRQHNFGEDEDKGYTIIYSDGSHKFIKNQVNTRYATIAITSNKFNKKGWDKELMDWVHSQYDCEKYNYKFRLQVDGKLPSNITTKQLLALGFNKVKAEVVQTEEVKVAASSSIYEKYDKETICKQYEEYCDIKQHSKIIREQGLECLNTIN